MRNVLFLLRVLAEKVQEPAVQKALTTRAYLGLFIGVAPGRAQVCEISFELSIELLNSQIFTKCTRQFILFM